ncbi:MULTISPECIES: hypothetical protein [Methanohalophilus]|nr:MULTISPECIES: hypothetical protein [Methanohalophilus]
MEINEEQLCYGEIAELERGPKQRVFVLKSVVRTWREASQD